MLEKGKISGFTILFILQNLVGANSVTFLPAITSKFAGRDSWMVSIIGSIPAIAVILIITELGRRFSGKTIIEYVQIILGNRVGKAVGTLYLFFFVHTTGITIREFGEMTSTFMLNQTPIIVLILIFTLLAAFAVHYGLEIIGRVTVSVMPVVLTLYTGLLLLSLQNANFNNLLPVLENGFFPVLMGSIPHSAMRGEVVLLAMLLPFLAEPGKGRVLGVWSVIFLGVFLVADAVVNTLVFGPSTARLVFPTFTLSREILVGGILRLDVFWIFNWLAGIFVKISIFYYAVVLGTAQLLNLKDYKPLVLPTGVILVALSILSVENSAGIPVYLTTGFPPFAYLIEWIIPLILLLITIMRGLYIPKCDRD